MEGVIAVQSLYPQTPVIWFSKDRDFDAQSYWLNATYLYEKPVTTQILDNALANCKLV